MTRCMLVVWLSALLVAGCDRDRAGGDYLAKSVQRLGTLPYAKWSREPNETTGSGVIVHDREKAWQGLNLYTTINRPESLLVDMDGRVVHRWTGPDAYGEDWVTSELGPDGSLYVVVRDRAVLKLARDSTLIWAARIRAHHDLDTFPGGEVYALDRKVREFVDRDGRAYGFLVDQVTVLGPGGEVRRVIPLFDLFGHLVSQRRRDAMKRIWARLAKGGRVPGVEPDGHAVPEVFNVFHTNTVEVIRSDTERFRAGQLLVSMRDLDLVAVIDQAGPSVVWSWGRGELDRQHHPTLLPSGHVLVFDNGYHRGWSRILEVDPATDRILWTFEAEPRGRFFSKTRGGNQLLPNGDVLITESDRGRVFEITRAGEVVWEYLNPLTTRTRRGSTRGTIYRMTRVAAGDLGWLSPRSGSR